MILDAAGDQGVLHAPGYLLVLAIILPVAGVLLSFVLGGRNAERTALCVIPVGLGVVGAILYEVSRTGQTLTYVLGGWQPPLGIALRADGLSAAMLVTTALVIGATGLFARSRLPHATRRDGSSFTAGFLDALLAVWAALNAVFLGSDLFNLYVALELLTFGAVPLVCLSGRADTIAAALRYLHFCASRLGPLSARHCAPLR